MLEPPRNLALDDAALSGFFIITIAAPPLFLILMSPIIDICASGKVNPATPTSFPSLTTQELNNVWDLEGAAKAAEVDKKRQNESVEQQNARSSSGGNATAPSDLLQSFFL
mmetsp:Transcript_18497/g.25721  ORF Transcript_18497/g.25721 Transcript_18497/m.25721 type:complete len:111 (+) Transcript_18497:452-784(+)|eukprot:CAMPEP_0184490258 /NCGR_PEP_ID=MMETSP0113_2-20130426/17426_1 /TAXON_ID=91329 /ORGANISM="Norrisiella sphaerica, Strain BC52" /LENGTH=110 /DNA_ID=CAMNT_0026874049 /DNA_START=500 /DNA_END=832 /DNA_ORIENTATION=+